VRPYKKAWTPEDAMDHIQAQAGRHFDPVLVGLFRPLLPTLLEIRSRWAD
jgi:putative two-component system response regulator